jgi:hypothetical protein
MNPYLIWIECLAAYTEAAAPPLTPDERRAQFMIITGGKSAA